MRAALGVPCSLRNVKLTVASRLPGQNLTVPGMNKSVRASVDQADRNSSSGNGSRRIRLLHVIAAAQFHRLIDGRKKKADVPGGKEFAHQIIKIREAAVRDNEPEPADRTEHAQGDGGTHGFSVQAQLNSFAPARITVLYQIPQVLRLKLTETHSCFFIFPVTPDIIDDADDEIVDDTFEEDAEEEVTDAE